MAVKLDEVVLAHNTGTEDSDRISSKSESGTTRARKFRNSLRKRAQKVSAGFQFASSPATPPSSPIKESPTNGNGGGTVGSTVPPKSATLVDPFTPNVFQPSEHASFTNDSDFVRDLQREQYALLLEIVGLLVELSGRNKTVMNKINIFDVLRVCTVRSTSCCFKKMVVMDDGLPLSSTSSLYSADPINEHTWSQNQPTVETVPTYGRMVTYYDEQEEANLVDMSLWMMKDYVMSSTNSAQAMPVSEQKQKKMLLFAPIF